MTQGALQDWRFWYPPAIMATLLLSLLAAVGVVGLALITVGLRGRRVGDHPHCRRCGHDLFGADSGACPECGADVTRPNTRKTGQFERRRGPLIVGLALLVPALLVAAALATLAARGYDWNRAKPGWWLVGDLADDARYLAVVGELQRRHDDGGLAAGTATAAADALLVRQADADQPWHPDAGNFIESLHHADSLGDGRWATYTAHAVVPVVLSRPVIRQGDPLPMVLDLDSRPTTFGRAWLYGGVRSGADRIYVNVSAELPGTDQPLQLQAIASSRSSGVATEGGVDVPGEVTADWPVGPRALRLTLECEAALDEENTRGYGAGRPLPGAVAGRRTLDVDVEIEVLPPDAAQPLVEADPAQAPAAGAVRGWPVPPQAVASMRQPALVGLAFDADAFPPLADHDVYAQTAAGRLRLGKMSTGSGPVEVNVHYAPAGDGWGGGRDDDPLAGLDAVDVVLVPDLAGALRRTEPQPVWHGEVRVPNVPVSRAGDATKPPGYGSPPLINVD